MGLSALCISFHLIFTLTYEVSISILLRKENNLVKVTASKLQGWDSAEECMAPRSDSAEHQRPLSIPGSSTNQPCALASHLASLGLIFPICKMDRLGSMICQGQPPSSSYI